MNKVRVATMVFSIIAITTSAYSLILSSRSMARLEAARAPKVKAAEREQNLAWSTCMKIMLEGSYSWPASEETCKVLIEEEKP
jgi:hypothetical protein